MCAFEPKSDKVEKKYLVTFIPSAGTPWVGRKFTLNIYPGKTEAYPEWHKDAGKRYVPKKYSVVLNSGDAVVIDKDAYEWYTNPDISGAFKDKTLKIEEITTTDAVGFIRRGYVTKDDSWSTPANKGEPMLLKDGTYLNPQGK